MTRAGAAAFQVIPVGRGAVWLASAAWLFTNAGVVQTGLPIALPLAWANGRSARLDLYHQSAGGHLNVLAYLPEVWTLLVAEAVLAGLLLVAALLRRPGPVWPEPEHLPGDPDLAPSLAALYAKNHHAQTMARALADDDARRLGSRAHAVEGQLQRLREAHDPDTAVLAWRELRDAERR